MARGNAKHGFKDNVGQKETEREESGRYLQVERQVWKGKTYITIGWCVEGKDGKDVHLAGKQVWMTPAEFKSLYEDALTPAYKVVK